MYAMLNYKKFVLLVVLSHLTKYVEPACERSTILLGAEDVCWAMTVKVLDRIQYTTKSVLNFAKGKLGLDTDDPFIPQQCDYYECIFRQMKMLNDNGYPNYGKIVEWIDNNVVYIYAKTEYDLLKDCHGALTESIENNTYFSGDLQLRSYEERALQNKCEVSKEFMKCIANNTECLIFAYP